MSKFRLENKLNLKNKLTKIEPVVLCLPDSTNAIYRTGIIPKQQLQSIFITIPKNQMPEKCSDYQIISLMSQTLETLLKVLHKRIYNKLEGNISNTQFVFRNRFGTIEALFSYNVLTQRCLDMSHYFVFELFGCFIDH